MTYDIFKRFLDIIMAIFCLIILFPVCFICLIAIVLESPGPILADTPRRVGQGGKLFQLLKLRSMIPNAHKLLHTDPKYKLLLEKYKKSSYKLHEDPRVTKVGKFIRKYSIDEIPQLVNVLRGEMSIVGPRPYYPDEIEEQQKKYPQTEQLVREVLKVKPGVTGEWQVSGRSEINFDKRIKMDADYARRRSVIYDINIILKTPWAMVSGKGAV